MNKFELSRNNNKRGDKEYKIKYFYVKFVTFIDFFAIICIERELSHAQMHHLIAIIIILKYRNRGATKITGNISDGNTSHLIDSHGHLFFYYVYTASINISLIECFYVGKFNVNTRK